MELIDDNEYDHQCEINRNILKPKKIINGKINISAKLIIFNEYYTGGIKNKFIDVSNIIFDNIDEYISNCHIYDKNEIFNIDREKEMMNIVTDFNANFKTIKSINNFINDTRLFMHGFEDGSADGYLCGDAVVFVDKPFTKENINDMSDNDRERHVYEIAFENMTFELRDEDNNIIMSIHNNNYWNQD